MRNMKDSEAKWVGKKPTNWELGKIKYYARIKTGSTPDTNIHEWFDGDINWFTPGDFSDAFILKKSSRTLSSKAVSDNIVFPFPKGVVMIVGIGATAGKVGFTIEEGYCNQQITALISYKINPKFLMYWLVSNTDILCGTALYTTLPIINNQMLGNHICLCPIDICLQKRIADFLDKKCSKIDALTADIKKQIETLEEYKRSVITEAVTKGLNSDVEMKDSGIEWIEDIPQGWEINRIKYLFSNGKGLPITKENLIDEGLSVISYGQIHAKFNTGVDISNDLIRFVSYNYERLFPQCKVFQYDFVFADTSEDYDGCGNCVYKRDDSLLYAGYHTIILHSLKRNDNRYFAYLFQTDLWRKQIRCAVSGVKVFSITQKIIMNAQVIMPSPKEQQQIANYLDCKCSEIDSVIKEKQQQLETLTEYKKSLIYEYVTGKKEVL